MVNRKIGSVNVLQYDVEKIADELMFTTSELKEILDIYFEEAIELLQECHSALDRQDYAAVGKIIHALKGSSSNLRITTVTEIATELEQMAISGEKAPLFHYLPIIQDKIAILKEHIDVYYADVIK